MSSFIEKLILTLLSIVTLRDVLIYFGIVRIDSKLGKIIYGRYSNDIVKHALVELGFKIEDFTTLKKQLEITARKIAVKGETIKDPYIKLVNLLAKNFICFGKQVKYGDVTPKSSNYYLNTMEASHNQEDLDCMTSLIYELVNQDYKDGIISKFPDFILTPKSGNPLLGYNFAKTYERVCIFKKGIGEKSSAKLSDDDYEYKLKTNYEGMWDLLRICEKDKDRELVGIIIDCNSSGGTQILDVLNDFNRIIEKQTLNIKPVTNAYILFRSDDSIDLDRKFADMNYRLVRYLDLNEEMKESLYSTLASLKSMNQYIPENQGKIVEYLDMLKEKGLIKSSIKYK